MSNKVKDAVIKLRTYCSWTFPMINIKNFDPNKIKTAEKSHKIFLFTTLDM